MKSFVKRIIIKTIICIVVAVIIKVVIGSYEPILNNDIAIQQLNGGDYEFAQMRAYNQIKEYASYGYSVFVLLIYGSEAVKLLKNYETNKNIN